MFRVNRVAPLVVLSVLLVALVASVAQAGSSDKAPDYTDSPYSGAYLNRLAAQNPAPAPPFLSQPTRTINGGSVNDPSADTTAQDTQSETTVTAAGNNVVIGFNDSGSYNGSNSHFTGWSSSSDKGATFTDRGALPASATGDAGDPSLASNTSTGDIFMATLGFNSGAGIQVFKSTNGGVSFGAPVNGIPGGSDLDKEWMAIDNFAGTGHGNIYLCATDFGFSPARIVVSHSTDNGATWGPSGGVVLSSTGQSQGCYVAVGPDHSVDVFYFRGNSPNKLYMRRSTDQGATFGSESTITTLNTTSVNGGLGLNGGARSNSFPHAAVNPVSGDIVVVWNDDPPPALGSDRGNIFYSESTDDGATWSPAKKVNEDGPRDQFFPTIAISPTGKRIIVGYYSRSHDPANFMFHRRERSGVMNTTSGAITLRRSAQIGPDTPIVIGQDPVINTVYMGDYDVIAATNSNFVSSWADNRNGDSFHTHQPDVHAARIQYKSAITQADVSTTVTATPATINQGDATTLKLSATATGNSARDVYVSLAPTNHLTYTAVGGGASCQLVGNFVGCSLGTIPAGTTVTRNVTAVATSSGNGTAKARVTTTDNDPGQSNNTDTATVTVNPAAGVTQTFSTGNIAVPIPDVSTVNVPLSIGQNKTIFDADALVRLNHTFDGDLIISLVSPGGATTIPLSNRRGSSGDNYGSGNNDCSGTLTRFNDEAPNPISGGTAPFAGPFSPDSPLSALDGSSMQGTWNLRITDAAAADTGTIGCFKLRILHSP